LFDPQLSARGRWKLDNTSYVDLGVAGPRQVTTESTRALLPNEALGPARSLSNSTDPRKRMGRPTLLETPAFTIVCLPKDERMSVDAPASCERVTAPAWRLSGNGGVLKFYSAQQHEVRIERWHHTWSTSPSSCALRRR